MERPNFLELVKPFLPDAFEQIEEAGGTCGIVHPQFRGFGVYIFPQVPSPEELAQMMYTVSMLYGGALFIKLEPDK